MGSGPVSWCIRRHSSINCAYNLGTLLTFQGSNQAKILKFEVKHQTSIEYLDTSFHAQYMFEKLSSICYVLLTSQRQKVLNKFWK